MFSALLSVFHWRQQGWQNKQTNKKTIPGFPGFLGQSHSPGVRAGLAHRAVGCWARFLRVCPTETWGCWTRFLQICMSLTVFASWTQTNLNCKQDQCWVAVFFRGGSVRHISLCTQNKDTQMTGGLLQRETTHTHKTTHRTGSMQKTEPREKRKRTKQK